MRDHRSAWRWRRAIARTTTRFRRVDSKHRLGGVGHADRLTGEWLPEASHVQRSLR